MGDSSGEEGVARGAILPLEQARGFIPVRSQTRLIGVFITSIPGLTNKDDHHAQQVL